MRTIIDKILLLDDDPDDAFLLGKALEELPATPQLFAIQDCDELLPALSLHRPDLVFMDMNMPKHNGLDCIRLLQRTPSYMRVPVIMYSSSEQASLIAAAYQSGATLFFRKPSTFDAIVDTLQFVLDLDWSDPVALRTAHYGEGLGLGVHTRGFSRPSSDF